MTTTLTGGRKAADLFGGAAKIRDGWRRSLDEEFSKQNHGVVKAIAKALFGPDGAERLLQITTGGETLYTELFDRVGSVIGLSATDFLVKLGNAKPLSEDDRTYWTTRMKDAGAVSVASEGGFVPLTVEFYVVLTALEELEEPNRGPDWLHIKPE